MLLPLFQSGEIKLFLQGLQSFSLEDVKAKHSSFSLVFHLSLKLKKNKQKPIWKDEASICHEFSIWWLCSLGQPLTKSVPRVPWNDIVCKKDANCSLTSLCNEWQDWWNLSRTIMSLMYCVSLCPCGRDNLDHMGWLVTFVTNQHLWLWTLNSQGKNKYFLHELVERTHQFNKLSLSANNLYNKTKWTDKPAPLVVGSPLFEKTGVGSSWTKWRPLLLVCLSIIRFMTGGMASFWILWSPSSFDKYPLLWRVGMLA